MLSYEDRPTVYTTDRPSRGSFSSSTMGNNHSSLKQSHSFLHGHTHSHPATNVHATKKSVRYEPAHQHIWIITGPAGSGKTTVAEYLAAQLHIPYIEGDLYHPQANLDKMSNNIPLTDADRWDWLIILRQEAMKKLSVPENPANHLQQPSSSSNGRPSGVVLTCSALKRKYRDVIRIAAYEDPHTRIHFIFLSAEMELLIQRVRARQDHYMKDSMVVSQFAALEPPKADELDVISIDVSKDQKLVQIEALEKMMAMLQQDTQAVPINDF